MYRPSLDQVQQVQRGFRYHPPRDDQVPRYERLRRTARDLATEILSQTPPSREQSLALTHLEEAVMWANAAIARNEPNDTTAAASPPRPAHLTPGQ